MNPAAHNDLPPVVRVFLSSTFSDMEHERSYFNEVLAPKLSRLCARRGVSFFSVDLRWGITQEEQVDGQVLPICLGEIDKCRPFFIGILGNRYGSVMEAVPPQIGDGIPWLSGKEGKSITELEMLYAVLDKGKDETAQDCTFYFRSDELSTQWYGAAPADGKLEALKVAIRSDDSVSSMEYGSLEEFGRAVMADMESWLDREFPVPEKVAEVRRAWYDRELLRGYIPTPQLNSFLDTYFRESDRSLLFWGDGARGKTTFLTAWEPACGKKLLVNCGSDDVFLYWPAIALEIVRQADAWDPELGSPTINARASLAFCLMQAAHDPQPEQDRLPGAEFYFVTDREREDFRLAFLDWLNGLQPKEDMYIVVNDLNLLDDDCSRFLSWLPVHGNSRVHIVCSSNRKDMIENAETLGWNCKEMPLFTKEQASVFLPDYLHIFGKNLSAAQKQTLLRSEVSAYPGQLRFMADFLIRCGRFHNLDRLIGDLAEKREPRQVYEYAFGFAAGELTQQEQDALRLVLGLLRCAAMSLNEQECLRLTQQLAPVTAIQWANIRNVFEQFGLVQGDYWNMRSQELQKFTDELLTGEELAAIQNLLGEHMLRKLHDGSDRGSQASVRERTAYAKAALNHFRHASNWEKLTDTLCDHSVLTCLSDLDWQAVQVAWMAVFLHSDTDIPSVLLDLLRQYLDREERNEDLILQIAGLFTDLEFRSHLPQVYELVGTTQLYSGHGLDGSNLRPEFVELYNSLCDLKNQADFRALYAQAKAALEKDTNCLPMEQCQLLFFQGDSESHLQLPEACLETSGRYYEAAIRAASVYEIRRALSLRGDVLYRMKRYEEAAALQLRVRALALQDGDIRIYLSACNILAMCQYRTNRFDKSIENFHRLQDYWQRLGNVHETANVWLNLCNALALSGDHRAALAEAEKLYDFIPADAKAGLKNTRISLQGNIGNYLYNLKEYDRAESHLLQAIDEAEKAGLEATVLNAMGNLIDVYTESDRFTQAVDIYRKQMELLWQRRAYRDVVKQLRKAVNLLRVHQYGVMAQELQSEWEYRFSKIPGGSDFFSRELDTAAADRQKLAELKEQLVLARSEADPRKAAQITCQMADTVLSGDWEQSVTYLLDAAALFEQAGDPASGETCLYQAVVQLFDNGSIKNSALFSAALEKITDPHAQRVIALWKHFGTAGNAGPAKRSGLAALLKKSAPAAGADQLLEIAAHADRCEYLVLHCLMDLTGQIIARCKPEETVRLVQSLPEKPCKDLSQHLCARLVENTHQDITFLTKNYTGPEAERILAYYEAALQIMLALGTGQIAAIAGNLAIIFRRRKEADKTFHYHKLSMERYQQAGETKDYLIELTNLATAYRDFGQTQQAIDLIEKGMNTAAQAKEHHMEASLAGNLAALLSRLADPAYNDRIIRCFNIEEAFFRRTNSQRELAISLLNQVSFYHRYADTYGQVWKQKLAEGGTIVRQNKFREFEKALFQMEQLAGAPAASGDSPEEMLQRLLAADGCFQLDKLTVEENNIYHAVCSPKTESKTEHQLLHLLMRAEAPYIVRAIGLCQPKMGTKQAAPAIEEYTAWWNVQNEYQLQLQEDLVLQGTCDICHSDWDEVVRQFCRFSKLWNVDATSLGMMAMGLTDLAPYQNLKRKLLLQEQS